MAAWVGYAFGIEPEWLEPRTVGVAIRGLGKEFDGYRIALFSDVHYPRNIDRAYIRRVCSVAMESRPDLVAIPGDFCDGKFVRSVPNLSGLFDSLSAPDGLVGTLGNHDHWLDGPGVQRAITTQTPIRLIDNRSFLIERGASSIAIGGVGDLWEDEHDANKAFDGIDPDIPRILLSHNPDYAEDMEGTARVDLQLSGHTHGGEMRLPFGPAPFVPSRYGQKFREGLVKGKRHLVYVTRGVCSPRHVRFWCRPEITTIVLRPGEARSLNGSERHGSRQVTSTVSRDEA